MTLKNTEFEFRTDFNITDRNIASLKDITSLHNVVDDGYSGDGITVVVMDSGIDDAHPVFDDGQVTKTVDVVGGGPGDEVGHGTACAGLIAQLAPDVDLISLRIFGDSGRTSGKTIFEAYQWLITHSDEYDVVNMSWGARQKVQQIDDKHNRLVEEGVYPVVAAGNTGDRGGSPATAEKAFSAGAVDEHGELTRFSSYNPNYDNPDVAAIGKNNRLARADGTDMGSVIDEHWTKASGTSFSAPIVSAFVARALEKYGDLPSVAKHFEANSRDIPDTPRDGAGISDYEQTLAPDNPVGKPEPDKPSVNGTAWNFAGHDTLYIGADWLHSGKATVTKVAEDEDSVTLKVEQRK